VATTKEKQMKRLDLHGVRHKDVRRKVIRVIEDSWCKEEEIEIITGHSQRMKEMVMSVLNEYNLSCNTDYLYGKNSPRIIIWT
jgi:hypothetical protein